MLEMPGKALQVLAINANLAQYHLDLLLRHVGLMLTPHTENIGYKDDVSRLR